MGGLSLPHLIVVALIVLVLFGRGRISEMMGDFGKGIKSFKRGIEEEFHSTDETPPLRIAHGETPAPAQSATASAQSAADPSPNPRAKPGIAAPGAGEAR
jgi:sec-independent protein translocase protein TatA